MRGMLSLWIWIWYLSMLNHLHNFVSYEPSLELLISREYGKSFGADTKMKGWEVGLKSAKSWLCGDPSWRHGYNWWPEIGNSVPVITNNHSGDVSAHLRSPFEGRPNPAGPYRFSWLQGTVTHRVVRRLVLHEKLETEINSLNRSTLKW